MTIKALPTISDQIYLQDLNEDVKAMEGGDCPRDEQAWVTVRQATESDAQRRASLVAKRRTERSGDKVVEEWTDNVLEVYATEVYSCLVDCGNILDAKDNPLFEFMDATNYQKVKGGYKKFRASYGDLPLCVTRAMRQAVLQLNPQWDWLTQLTEDEEGED